MPAHITVTNIASSLKARSPLFGIRVFPEISRRQAHHDVHCPSNKNELTTGFQPWFVVICLHLTYTGEPYEWERGVAGHIFI